MTLAELSLKRPVTAIMFFVSMVVIGLIAAFRLPLEQFPSIDAPFLFVQHPVPGFDADRDRTHDHAPGRGSAGDAARHQAHELDVGRRVARRSSSSSNGARASRSRRCRRARRSMRSAPTCRPTCSAISCRSSRPPTSRCCNCASPTTSGDLSNAYELLEREIKRPLERIPGVAAVDICRRRQARGADRDVVRSAERAQHQPQRSVPETVAARISPSRRARSTTAARVSACSRKASGAASTTSARFRSTRRACKLGDIADVDAAPGARSTTRAASIGSPAVGVDIYRERNANLVDVGSAVMAEVERIQPATRTERHPGLRDGEPGRQRAPAA